MLIGSAVGLLAGVASVVLFHGRIRAGLAVGVVGIPSLTGVLAILLSGRRWVTMLGAFLLAWAPGWLVMLVALQVVSGG